MGGRFVYTGAVAHVTILGAGMMGTATAFPLAECGHTVDLVGTHLDDAAVEAIVRDRVHPRLAVAVPDGVRAVKLAGLEEALARADAVVLGVSSAGLGWAAETLGRTLPRTLPIAMVTKGLEAVGGALVILPDCLRDGLPPARRVEPVMIGGPCIAGELARGTPSTVVPSSRDAAAAQAFARLAHGPTYRTVVDDDVVGVCACAALKNAYAVAVGVAAGLQGVAGGVVGPVAYHNLEASTFGRALGEMARVVEALGGRRETAFGLAGAGDLFVTCQGGRSTRLGRLLGGGRSLAAARQELSAPGAPVTLESVDVTATVLRALPRGLSPADVPILDCLRAILFEGAPAETLVQVA
jgi:glycerol-3-phosphate dehydrogenase (NAD(P)+)